MHFVPPSGPTLFDLGADKHVQSLGNTPEYLPGTSTLFENFPKAFKFLVI